MSDRSTATIIREAEALTSAIGKTVEVSKDFVERAKELQKIIQSLEPNDPRRAELTALRDKLLGNIRELNANTSVSSGSATAVISYGTSGRR